MYPVLSGRHFCFFVLVLGALRIPQRSPERVLLSFLFFLYWESQWMSSWKSFKNGIHPFPAQNWDLIKTLSGMEFLCSLHRVVNVTTFPCHLILSPMVCLLAPVHLGHQDYVFLCNSTSRWVWLAYNRGIKQRCWLSLLRWKHLPYYFSSFCFFPVYMHTWPAMLEWSWAQKLRTA